MASRATALRITGANEISRALLGLAQEMRVRGAEQALRAGGRVVVEAARRNLDATGSVETGLLKKSIGLVMRGRRNTPKYVVLGARNSVIGTAPDGKKRWPTKYAHLVEFGHFAVVPTSGVRVRRSTAAKVRYIPGRPFLVPALVGNREAIKTAMVEKLSQVQKNYADRIAASRAKAT